MAMANPNNEPQPMEASRGTPETIKAKRRLYCKKYNGCLSIAVMNKWKGFTCAGCTGYEQMSMLEARADVEGFVGLLQAMSSPRGERWRPVT